jgi:hypothetical protein
MIIKLAQAARGRTIFRWIGPWVEWVGSGLLWLEGIKSCGEWKASGSFDYDAQKARVSAQDDAFWGRGQNLKGQPE